MQILLHINTEVTQVYRQTGRLIRRQGHIPIIQGPQIRLDVLGASDQFMPLLLRHTRIDITDRQDERKHKNDGHTGEYHKEYSRCNTLVSERYLELI